MKTLKLFNAVVAMPHLDQRRAKPFLSEHGYVIDPKALWAKNRIITFYEKEALDGRALNATFHKSWQKIRTSSRYELALEQIAHYLSTYGTDFQGDIYLPDEVLKVPDVKVVLKVVRAYTREQLIEKCLAMLRSGAALKEETVDDLLSVLVDELGYTFTGEEGVRNKEAVAKIADLYGILPKDFQGFFRYVVLRATNSAVVIKNPRTVEAIKASSFNPAAQFQRFGLERLAEHFNRNKPLFLAFKPKCPATINKIAKLSKTLHKPMPQNPLNLATQRRLIRTDLGWLDNATPYALFRALAAVRQRANGQNAFVYKVRNGKSWAQESKSRAAVCDRNYDFLLDYIEARFDLSDKRIFIPEDVEYAVPTSEKMYVGNIPMGTKFYGKKLAVGVYWENDWGARDLDLSGLSADGKVGWNAAYGRGGFDNDGLMYSGDITSAPEGAVEYLYAQRGIPGATLILNNVFYGADDCEFKIIVGRGDRVTQKFMMNPNNLFVEARVKSVQKQSIIGLLLPERDRQAFVLLNLGAGSAQVSSTNSERSMLARTALTQEWSKPLSLNWLVRQLGAELVNDPKRADVDLSLSTLERDSFMRLFSEQPKAAA